MYIRTKDGIYQIVEDNNKEWGKQIVVKFPKNLNMKLADVKDQVINQSDNLAELCDEFIVIDISGKHYHTYDLESAKKYVSIIYIYGAIWTSKGLIYVAKMNNEGNLELL